MQLDLNLNLLGKVWEGEANPWDFWPLFARCARHTRTALRWNSVNASTFNLLGIFDTSSTCHPHLLHPTRCFLPFLIDSDHINSNCGARMTFMCLMIKFMVSKISNSSSKLWSVHTSHWQIARLLLHSWARWSALELFCEYFNFPWSLAQSIFHITACCDEKIVIMTSSDIMLVNPLGFWIAFLDEVKGFMSNNGASSMKHLDNQPQQYCLFITLNVWFFIQNQSMLTSGGSYGQAYSNSYDATSSNYAVSKRSARSLPQVKGVE